MQKTEKQTSELINILLQKSRDIAECVRLALEVLDDNDLVLTEPPPPLVE
jgi:hypothetical protein